DPPNFRLIFVIYSKFFKRYLLPNHPFIKQWITEEEKPTFQKLLQQFDETLVPVANSDVKEYNYGHSSPKGWIFLNVYTTPIFFSSDWFNKYWDTLEVDNYLSLLAHSSSAHLPFQCLIAIL
uniref:Uncharacterized protein n=1 Tax=Oncorhynchus tshawytscha TaxID=74940 RepID=A0A8C8GJT2_ONCTS